MKNKRHIWGIVLLLVMTICFSSMTVFAGEASDDNSLASLGINTAGAEVSPEFSYDRIEYNVTVPAGTQTLDLSPVTSNENASIVDISGTTLNNGETTVVITVQAENGSQYAYYLYVKADGEPIAVPEEQKETKPAEEKKKEKEKQKETEKIKETEPETEDPRYVKVDRNSLEEAENTITALKTETSNYRNRVGILTKILYGMIAFCVILLFIVINLLLKKKDLKAELKAYRGYGFPQDMPNNYDSSYQDGYQGGYGDNYESYDSSYDVPYYDEPYDGGEYYDELGYGSQNYDGNAYQGQNGYEGYDNSGAYGQQQTPNGEPQAESPKKKEKPKKQPKVKKEKKEKNKKGKDDPETVPKPENAKVQNRQMPEYQEPQQPYEYKEPQTDKKSGDNNNNVEVTMIDL